MVFWFVDVVLLFCGFLLFVDFVLVVFVGGGIVGYVEFVMVVVDVLVVLDLCVWIIVLGIFCGLEIRLVF